MKTYFDEMKEKIKAYITNEVDVDIYNDVYDMADDLYDALYKEDVITGVASGSYYCNSKKAKEKVMANIEEVANEFRYMDRESLFCEWIVDCKWEDIDVFVRESLLLPAIQSACEDLDN